MTRNIFLSLPLDLETEISESLLRSDCVRIERIVSKGHCSPEQGWYDQADNEWVMVLAGVGTLLFEDGEQVTLAKGDYLNIPAHCRHKVIWTDPDVVTLWLAVFYR